MLKYISNKFLIAGISLSIALVLGIGAYSSFYVSSVSSITALQNLGPASPQYSTMVVTGIQGAGDTFQWISGSLPCDVTNGGGNSGTTFCAINRDGSYITTGYWQRQYLGPLHANWFGAKCDGTTDDTAIFNEIWKAAGINGSWGIFEPKTCIAGNLVITDANQVITIVKGATLKSPIAEKVFDLQNTSGTTINMLGTIDGNSEGVLVSGAQCIFIGEGANTTINGGGTGLITHCGDEGITSYSAPDLTLKDFKVMYTGGAGIHVNMFSGSTDIPGLRIQNITCDETSWDPTTINYGCILAHAASSVGYPNLLSPIFSNITTFMPTDPTDISAIGLEIWNAENGSVNGLNAEGGTMGLSFGNFSGTATNINASGFNTYGIECGFCNNGTSLVGGVLDGDDIGSTGIQFDDYALSGRGRGLIQGFTIRNLKTTINTAAIALTGISATPVDANITITGNTILSGRGCLQSNELNHITFTGNICNNDMAVGGYSAIQNIDGSYWIISGNDLEWTEYAVIYNAASVTMDYLTTTGNILIGGTTNGISIIGTVGSHTSATGNIP